MNFRFILQKIMKSKKDYFYRKNKNNYEGIIYYKDSDNNNKFKGWDSSKEEYIKNNDRRDFNNNKKEYKCNKNDKDYKKNYYKILKQIIKIKAFFIKKIKKVNNNKFSNRLKKNYNLSILNLKTT